MSIGTGTKTPTAHLVKNLLLVTLNDRQLNIFSGVTPIVRMFISMMMPLQFPYQRQENNYEQPCRTNCSTRLAINVVWFSSYVLCSLVSFVVRRTWRATDKNIARRIINRGIIKDIKMPICPFNPAI
jgi:hypothetical protein